MSLTGSVGIWRGLSIFLLLVILLQFYWILSEDRNVLSKLRSTPTRQPIVPLQRPSEDAWIYDPERDARNTGLSFAQCDHAFPELYYEIDRAKSYWQDRGHNITREDTDISWRNDGALRVLINDNQLRILEVKKAWFNNPYRKRTLYVLMQLYRALLGAAATGENVPNVEFAMTVDDMSLIPHKADDTHSIWAFTRRLSDRGQDHLWIMPDFNFFASPPVATSYFEMQRRAKVHDAQLVEKIPKVVWRGVKWTNEFVRGHLVDATKDKDWADVVDIDWKGDDVPFIAMEDLCRYHFVAHTEGRSWSGRMKFLFNCDSLPIVHELDWTAEYYHMLTPDGPDQNYIPVKKDWSDLEEKVTYFLDHPDEAQRIANNSVATFRSRYTSPAAEACYWRRLIHGWSSVSFDPEPFEIVEVEIAGTTIKKQQLRGTAFEEFIWIPNDKS